MKAKADKTTSDELEREKLNLDRSRIEVERARCMNDEVRATTERLERLMDIVKYFNGQQEEERTAIESTYEKISMLRKSRTLNGHEEDIYNAALIQIKALIGFQSRPIAVSDTMEASTNE